MPKRPVEYCARHPMTLIPPHASTPTSRLQRAGRSLGADDGLTLIEVLVSALMVAIVAAASAMAFVGSTHASETVRLRSDAQALAQQDQNRLRGLTVTQLSNLSRTLPAVTLDGASFTVNESSQFVSDASGTPSCTNPSADYLQTNSKVTWTNMGSTSSVTVTGMLTPTVGAVDPTHGTLAVSVINAGGTGVAGMNVSISGPSSATQTTSAGGCALFGNLPTGVYNIAVAPATGTYVDLQSGQTVTPATPDTASPTVNAGTSASTPTQFQLDAAGSATFTFANAFPTGVSPSPAPPAAAAAVTVFNTNMNGQNPRVCSAADTTCPAVGSPDPTFPTWATSLNATPLFPTTYGAVYAGVCSSDAPHLFGATDPSATVTSGAGTGTPVSLTLPAMVVRLYTGKSSSSPGTEEPLPAGSHLRVKDTGCGVSYIGYTTVAPTLTAGQAALPLTTVVQAGSNDTGLLTYPGMPYGNYAVCYDNGSKSSTATVTNQASGEVVNVYAGSLGTTGVCT